MQCRLDIHSMLVQQGIKLSLLSLNKQVKARQDTRSDEQSNPKDDISQKVPALEVL